jgi:hypothetical protein
MRTILWGILLILVGVLIGEHIDSLLEYESTAAHAQRPVASDTSREWEKMLFVDVASRAPMACPSDGLTILVLGQSNAANTAGGRFRSQGDVFNWFDGRCYHAAGPMLGSDGVSGSIWPLVGDAMIDAKAAKSVTFANLTIGGTSARQWADSRGIGALLKRRVDLYKSSGLRIDFVLWQQGEADTKTPLDSYRADVESVFDVVRSGYPNATFVVARASLCGTRPSSPALVAAQSSLRGTLPGPNTDSLDDYSDRYDGCHFSETGARKLAALWAASLQDALRSRH